MSSEDGSVHGTLLLMDIAAMFNESRCMVLKIIIYKAGLVVPKAGL